jgi:hypothetical protein
VVESFNQYCELNNINKSALIESYIIEKCGFIDIELNKCKESPIYFINNYCTIQSPIKGNVPFILHSFQENIINRFDDNKWSITLQPRQMGMTSLAIAYSLWFMIFNDNKNIYFESPNDNMDKVMISKLKNMYNNLPTWFKEHIPTVFTSSIYSFKLSNNSNVGPLLPKKNIDLCVLDNASYISDINSQKEYIKDSSKIIMYSQSNKPSWFDELIDESISGLNDIDINVLHWKMMPGRTDDWKAEMENTLGTDEFKKQYIIE